MQNAPLGTASSLGPTALPSRGDVSWSRPLRDHARRRRPRSPFGMSSLPAARLSWRGRRGGYQRGGGTSDGGGRAGRRGWPRPGGGGLPAGRRIRRIDVRTARCDGGHGGHGHGGRIRRGDDRGNGLVGCAHELKLARRAVISRTWRPCSPCSARARCSTCSCWSCRGGRSAGEPPLHHRLRTCCARIMHLDTAKAAVSNIRA